jgi:hypothetical protein
MERYEWLLEANRYQDIFELRRDLDTCAPELLENKWTATKAIRSVVSGKGRPSAVVAFRSAPYVMNDTYRCPRMCVCLPFLLVMR